MLAEIITDTEKKITNHLSDIELTEYIEWRLPDITDTDELIKKLKVNIFDFEFVDVLLYDLDLSYRQFIELLSRIYPAVLTPAIIKRIKDVYED